METKKIDFKNYKIDRTQFEEPAYILRALANEIRLSVITLLSQKDEMTVTEMMNIIECEQSLLSYHLTDMRSKGILKNRKSGKNCFYSIKNQRVVQLLNCITR